MPKISENAYQADWEGSYLPVGTTNGKTFYAQMQVFLPPGTPPSTGWPVFFAYVYGGFATSALTSSFIFKPADGSSFALWSPWLMLEQGVSAYIRCSLVGTNSADYAPGGQFYEGGTGQFDLPEPLPGLATFDPYGFEGNANYMHHPYPGQVGGADLTFQSPYRNASYPPQKARELAHDGLLPLNPNLFSGFGRSAGGPVMSWMLWGPDEMDPSAEDHRRFSSRLQSAVIGASYAWFPAAKASNSGGMQFFPSIFNPLGASAGVKSQVPGSHLNQASPLRFMTRDWSNVAGGKAGPEHRALNGAKPVYLRYTDTDWGLDATVEEALTFNGTDANNNRQPALQNALFNVAHPAIFGPMTIARLLELEPFPDFASQFHRLVVRQETFDQLAGSFSPLPPAGVGVPAQSLVSDVAEDIEAADPITVGGQHLVDWQRQVWDAIQPGWDAKPEPIQLPATTGRDIVVRPSRRGDVEVGQVDLQRDPGLGAAVLVSLFTDRRLPDEQRLPDPDADRRGVWFDTPDDRWGSLLWTLQREKRLRSVLVRAEQYVREALEWLVEDGVCESIAADAEYVASRLVLRIDIRRGEARRWQDLWLESSRAAYAIDEIDLDIQFLE
ncbi:MAG: phage GP46 family protein [Planctomycetota bacterium]